MPIFDAVRSATRDDIWSRGVQLAREDRVLLISEDDDEFVLSVVPQGRARPATVHLWPDESDWSCDCSATLRPCIHIAAASIALRRARESGEGLPTGDGQAGVARVGYRFTRTGRGLVLQRVVVGGEEEVPLKGPVSGNHDGPSRLSFVDADTDAELAVARRFGGVVPKERLPRLFRALSDLSLIHI